MVLRKGNLALNSTSSQEEELCKTTTSDILYAGIEKLDFIQSVEFRHLNESSPDRSNFISGEKEQIYSCRLDYLLCSI